MHVNLYSKLSSSVLLRLTYVPVRKTSVIGYFEIKMVCYEKSKEIYYSKIGAKWLKARWWKELLIMVGDSPHMLQGPGHI